MRKMEIRKALMNLEELKETIYESLQEMKKILKEVAPEEYEVAKTYWIAHIDEALDNRDRWPKGCLTSCVDTIEALERMEMETEWDE